MRWSPGRGFLLGPQGPGWHQSLRAFPGILRILVLKRKQILTSAILLAFFAFNSFLFVQHKSVSNTVLKRARFKDIHTDTR